MPVVPDAYDDLFEKPSIATLATLSPTGYPHVTPVWIDYDGEHLLVNTARGRRKERNVVRNPSVGVSGIDPDDVYRYPPVTPSDNTDARNDHTAKAS